MTWVKLDDGFTDHPKVIGLSDRAFRVHVRALCYCARFSPGVGLIPKIALPLMGATKPVVNELVAARLWDVADSGEMTIHDFPEFHPKPDREAKANAGRVGGLKSGEARRQKREAPSEAETKQGASSTNEASGSRVLEAKRSSRADPDPTRPDPERSNDLSSQPGLPASVEAAAKRPPQSVPRAFASAERVLGRELRPSEHVLVGDWCAEMDPEWVVQALDITRTNGKTNLAYASAILRDWDDNGGPPERGGNSNQPTPLPVRRASSFEDPDYVGNMRKQWPTEEEMRAKEARQ